VAMMALVGILVLAGAAFPQSESPAAARVRDDDQAERVEPDLRGRTCGAISVTSAAQPRVRDRFSVRKTNNLMIRMKLSSRDEETHVVTFRFFTPNGHLYQEIQAMPRPEPGRRVSSIAAQLPVSGTVIATSSLFGRWRVVPYFDDRPRPCAAAAVFTVVQ
jgi:hypothetical protein